MSPMRSIRTVLNRQTLTKAGIAVGGTIVNAKLTDAIRRIDVVPSFLRDGPGKYLTGLGSAVLVGVGSAKFLPANIAAPLTFGAVFEVVAEIVKDYVVPLLPFSGMGDYLTRENAETARPLGYLGDYLTRENAATARPLGDYYGDSYIAQELASM